MTRTDPGHRHPSSRTRRRATATVLCVALVAGACGDDAAERAVAETGDTASEPAPTAAETGSDVATDGTTTSDEVTSSTTASGSATDADAAEQSFVMPGSLPGGYVPGSVAPFVPPADRQPSDLTALPGCEELRESIDESPATATAWEGFVASGAPQRVAVVSLHVHPDDAAAAAFVAGYNAPEFGGCIAAGLAATIPDVAVTLEGSAPDGVPVEVEHWARVRIASAAFGFETISYTVVVREGSSSVVITATFGTDVASAESDAAMTLIAEDIASRLDPA